MHTLLKQKYTFYCIIYSAVGLVKPFPNEFPEDNFKFDENGRK